MIKSPFVKRKVFFLATPRVVSTTHPEDVIKAVEEHIAAFNRKVPTSERKQKHSLNDKGRVFTEHVDRNKVKFYITTALHDPIPLVFIPEKP